MIYVIIASIFLTITIFGIIYCIVTFDSPLLLITVPISIFLIFVLTFTTINNEKDNIYLENRKIAIVQENTYFQLIDSKEYIRFAGFHPNKSLLYVEVVHIEGYYITAKFTDIQWSLYLASVWDSVRETR